MKIENYKKPYLNAALAKALDENQYKRILRVVYSNSGAVSEAYEALAILRRAFVAGGRDLDHADRMIGSIGEITSLSGRTFPTATYSEPAIFSAIIESINFKDALTNLNIHGKFKHNTRPYPGRGSAK